MKTRPFQMSDLPEVAKVFATAWRHGFRDLIPDEALHVDLAEWTERHGQALAQNDVLVAERDGEITGFAWLRPAPEAAGEVELHMLYTLPGEHAGIALVSEAIARLEANHTAITCWCLDTNDRARAFYHQRGFRPDGATRIVELAGARLPHTRLRRPLTLRSEVRRRPASRVVVRAPDGAILLMRHDNPALTNPTIWLTPGGKPEGEETLEDAARREFLEETGQPLTEPLRPIWNRRHIWSQHGEPVEAVEHFFLVEKAQFQPTTDGFTESERAVVKAFRWWSPAELVTTSEVIVPRALRDPSLLEADRPIWVGC